MKKGKKKLLLVFALLCCMLCSCGNKRPNGTYYMDTKFGTNILTFSGEEIRHEFFNGKILTGSFSMDGEIIKVTWSSGATDQYTYNASSDSISSIAFSEDFTK